MAMGLDLRELTAKVWLLSVAVSNAIDNCISFRSVLAVKTQAVQDRIQPGV
jgi:hypothetical protein